MLKSEGFKTLSKEAVISGISDPDLHATEEEVFEGMVLWGKAAVARSSCAGVGVDCVSGAVSELLPHATAPELLAVPVRLDETGHAFLYNRVKESGVFSRGSG